MIALQLDYGLLSPDNVVHTMLSRNDHYHTVVEQVSRIERPQQWRQPIEVAILKQWVWDEFHTWKGFLVGASPTYRYRDEGGDGLAVRNLECAKYVHILDCVQFWHKNEKRWINLLLSVLSGFIKEH